MRLWWNQSLASCGWWLVGDPSVRPSVRSSIRPSVHTSIHTSVKRASASVRVASPASTIFIDCDRDRAVDDHDRRVIIRERVATRILAPKIAPNPGCFRRKRVCCVCDLSLDFSERFSRREVDLSEQFQWILKTDKDWTTHLSIKYDWTLLEIKYVEHVSRVEYYNNARLTEWSDEFLLSR